MLVLPVILLGGICVQGWRAASDQMYGPPSRYPWTLADYPALARVASRLRVRSSTGVTLVGRFFRGRDGATIILSHGYLGNEDELLPVANMLHDAGFNVVTYNERGRAGSGGAGTAGALETPDLRSVVDAVVRHAHVDPDEIGEFGFSIGADISILEAAADRRIKAVVAVGSGPDIGGYVDATWADVILHPTSLNTRLSWDLLELRTGADIGRVRPVAAVARISPRPILLISGLDDTDVPPINSVIVYRHARAPKQLWLVKGAGHEDIIYPHGAAASPRIAAFFARALPPRQGAAGR